MGTKISVVIPTYNRANVLLRCVQSVLTQTFQNFEVIIVDDCSSDNTIEIVKTFKDPRISFIRHEMNRGGNSARNSGLRLAQGEYVAFLDSDDQWMPEKLERQLAIFQDPHIGLVYCGLIFINPVYGETQRWLVGCSKNFREDLLVSNFIGTTSAVLVRRDLLNQINGFDENLKSCQDWDLYLRLRNLCEFGYVDAFLVRYQINQKGKDQISTNPQAVLSGQKAILNKYSKDIALLSTNKKIERNDYLLRVFIGLAHLEGLKVAWNGFVLSRNPKYFYLMARIIVKYLLRKAGLK